MPTKTYYFDTIANCSKYINAYPAVAESNSKCLSYTLCNMPKKLKLNCTIVENRYQKFVIEPKQIYSIFIRRSSKFIHKTNGCIHD